MMVTQQWARGAGDPVGLLATDGETEIAQATVSPIQVVERENDSRLEMS